MGKRHLIIGAFLAAVFLVWTVPAMAEEDVPFVDGKAWKKSAPVLKRAYLIGLSNLMSAEYAYQQTFGPPPSSRPGARICTTRSALAELPLRTFMNNPG